MGFLFWKQVERIKERRLADEVAILERYERQRHAPGALPAKLAARLVRARKLLGNNQARLE